MNLHRLLIERAEAGHPVRVGLIGAGKFGTMFLAQALRTRGLHVMAVADLAPERAREQLLRVGWPAERIAATSLEQAFAQGSTAIIGDATKLIAAPQIEVVIDATGVPVAGIRHALLAIEHGKHIVMVNVEADVLAGPLLAERAARAGVVYSMAYGDQPARDGLGLLRPHARASASRRHEFADVQLLPRRHQIRDRDGGGGERDRAYAGEGRA